MTLLSLTERFFRKQHDKAAMEYLHQIGEMHNKYKKEVDQSISRLANEKEPNINFGTTDWGTKISLPLRYLLATHGLILGATGSGKSYSIISLILQILENQAFQLGFGILDPKSELFKKTLEYIAVYLNNVDEDSKEQLIDKLYIIDFANTEKIVPYNILARRENEPLELLITNRLDSFCELFVGSSALSTRMRSSLKYFLLLLAENQLPLTFFDQISDNQDILLALARRSRNERVKRYFLSRFKNESNTTLLALKQRIDTILVSESVRLSLSASEAPDFKKLQDEGAIVLINTAGPNIAKSTSLLLQMLVLSDIKQAVFQRNYRQKPFMWIMDEAQWFYRHRSSRENINDLLCMARSYGSFVWLLTQSLASAVSDAEIRNAILCNVRTILMLRSTVQDARNLLPALPITGMVSAPQENPLKPLKYLNPKEELKARLEEISHLQDRVGYLWLKTFLDKSIKITTPLLQTYDSTTQIFKNQIDLIMKKQSNSRSRDSILVDQRAKAEFLEQLLLQKASIDNNDCAPSENNQTLLQQLEMQYRQKGGDM